MINRTGVLSIMDRGLTINWEDGPTLHRMTAQIHYHTSDVADEQRIRVHAYQVHQSDTQTVGENLSEGEPLSEGEALIEDEALRFIAEEAMHVEWIWREITQMTGTQDGSDYWIAQLRVTNTTEESLYLDALDVISVEAAYSGQFNVGAPPDQWRCAREDTQDAITWEPQPALLANTGGFTHSHELLVQPARSNRSRPPAILIYAVREDAAEDTSSILSTEIRLQISGQRFETLVARTLAGGVELPPAQTFTSAQFLIASGDNPQELRKLVLSK